VLLREAEYRFRVIKRLSECFTGYRNPDLITHSLFSIVGQRVVGICCGYEDVVDHPRFKDRRKSQAASIIIVTLHDRCGRLVKAREEKFPVNVKKIQLI